MIDNLIEIKEIKELLGMTDNRSVMKWCESNKVPIFDIGRKKYTLNNFLEIFLEKEIKSFVTSTFSNPEEIMNAIRTDDKILLAESMDAPLHEKTKKNFIKKEKNTHSKAANEFLNIIKSK